MRIHRYISQTDWLLGGVMFLLCAVLTVLQYRWTGEIARAEMSRRSGNLVTGAQAIASAFDSELSAACDQLSPDRTEFANSSREAVHLARYLEWRAQNPRPIFRRIALAESTDNQVQLLLLDPESARFNRTNWPPDWSFMETSITQRARGGAPPAVDRRGMLLEFPVFAGGGRPGRSGEHWLILELDSEFLRTQWLPELVATHLNPGEPAVVDVRVSTDGPSPGGVYSSNAQLTERPREGVVSVRFNALGKTARRSDMPRRTSGVWTLEVWPRPGVLESVVARSRQRNLAVALGISLLMLLTGFALVHHTRRSRRLAEQQMRFVANVSHELRTPLTVIRGAAHNLRRGLVQGPGQIEQYAGLITRHAEQLSEMVEQVLLLSGPARKPADVSRAPVVVEALLNEAVAATAQDAQDARCEVRTRIPAGLPPVAGDAGALRRVFQNLLTNAAKHGGKGGWIEIAASAVEERGVPRVEITVTDAGQGVPPEELTEIFQPFFRGAAAQAAQIRGSGLGLALVREIVESHGGTVSARNVSGGETGAVFTVRLPAWSAGNSQ